MRQHFKRVVSAVLATALVAQVGVVSAWAAPFKAQEVPAAAGMHPFTGTPDLIRSAAEELKAQGVYRTGKAAGRSARPACGNHGG